MKTNINKKLAKEILERVKIDQIMRKQFIAGKKKWDRRIDERNTKWLKKTMAQYGWPTISLVGKRASHDAWFLAQHADHDLEFQKMVLKTIKEIHKKNEKEIKPADIAYLTDRILIHEKKPQIFGTQFTRKSEKEKFKPFPIKDKKNVDKKRKEYELPSLRENEKRINNEWKRLEGKKPRKASINKTRKPIVVAVSGGFDPVHIGHVRMFEEAKKLGDKLVVILNNDHWLSKKKGYVFMPQEERKEIIEAFACVDKVFLTRHLKNPKDMSVCAELKIIKPDIFANGGDRTKKNIPELAACEDIGCKMVFNVGFGGKVQSSSWLVKNTLPNSRKIAPK